MILFDNENRALEFTIEKKTESGLFEAKTPYREVVWLGETEEEAIRSMLYGVAELARSGAMDPDRPHSKGVPPIQHALNILSRALAWEIDCRRQRAYDVATLREDADLGNEVAPEGTAARVDADLARRNEVIAGIATAVAALARVKEL